MRQREPPANDIENTVNKMNHIIREVKEMFGELNKVIATVKEGIDTRSMDFRPLKDYVDKNINVLGFFFTEGKYGKQVVIVDKDYLVNMPARAVEQFETIANNPDMVKAMLEGHLALTNIKMIDTSNGTTTAYTLTDV